MSLLLKDLGSIENHFPSRLYNYLCCHHQIYGIFKLKAFALEVLNLSLVSFNFKWKRKNEDIILSSSLSYLLNNLEQSFHRSWRSHSHPPS
jgi:hypothetical protein